MKTIKLAICSFAATIIFTSSAMAGPGALLGFDIAEPNIFFQSTNATGQGTSYDAGSSTLTIASTPVFLTFSAGGADEFIIGGSLSMTATIDNTGALVGGSYSVSGTSTDSATSVTYSGVLAAGSVLDYGIIKTGITTAISDYLVTVDSGSLKGLFDAQGSTAGIIVAVENSTYDESFATSWAGTAKGDMGALPEIPPIEEFPHTIGYWKNHPEAWPVDNLTICGENLNQAELISILETPVRGDKTISMAHQLIAGILGGSGGSCPTLTNDAEAWLCDHGGIGAGRKKWDGGEALKDNLDFYNNGNGCDM